MTGLRYACAPALLAGSLAAWLHPGPLPLAAAHASLEAELDARDGLTVDALVWDGGSSNVPLRDAFVSRAFIVSAAAYGVPHRDVYLGFARRTADGNPIAISSLRNLTDTDDADEGDLVPLAHGAAFLTSYNAQVTGIGLVDLRADVIPEDESILTRSQRVAGNLLRFGTPNGIGIRTLLMARAIPSLSLTGLGDHLRISDSEGHSIAEIDEAGLIRPGSDIAMNLRLPPGPEPELVAWAVNTARDTPWIGLERIEYLKGLAFTANDMWNRSGVAAAADAPTSMPLSSEDSVNVPVALASTLQPGIGSSSLDEPPVHVAPIVPHPRPGEGDWEPITFHPMPAGAPPAMWTTVVSPDPDRDFAWVRLVAIDPRQLELHTMGGNEHPRSSTGFHDLGMVPTDPSTRERLVAAFSGGFQAAHGHYGMATPRGMLLPALAGIATVATGRDGSIRFGAWPAGPLGAAPGPGGLSEAAAIGAPMPPTLAEFRQNLPPLLIGDVINPERIRSWGHVLKEAEDIYTWRSALGATADGRLLFAVGPSLSADTLARALRAADCVWAMHLDMNISNVHFELYRPASVLPALPLGLGVHNGDPDLPGQPEMMNSAIMLSTDLYSPRFPRYLHPYERDFLYLLQRKTLGSTHPPAVGQVWQADDVDGIEPWRPVAAHAAIGAEEGKVSLVILDADALRLDLRSATDPHQVGTEIASWRAAAPRAKDPFGIHVGVEEKPPMIGAMTLGVGDDGRLKIGSWGQGLPPVKGDFLQGPTLLDGGQLVGGYLAWAAPRQRWGVGMSSANELLLAFGDVHSDAAIAGALLDAGAIIALDLSDGGGIELAEHGASPPWLPPARVPVRLDDSRTDRGAVRVILTRGARSPSVIVNGLFQ